MATAENAPFQLGSTIYLQNEVIDTANLRGSNLLGREYEFPDRVGGTDRSGQLRRVRLVRNVSGITLKPCRLASFRQTPGDYFGVTAGYGFAAAELAFPIDEFLPAAGVRNNDCFYVVVYGLAKVVVTNADLGSDLTGGEMLTCAAGTSATNDDAGRVAVASFAGATTALAQQIRNLLGYNQQAVTAVGSGSTKILAFVGQPGKHG